jgi:hypothetical protein
MDGQGKTARSGIVISRTARFDHPVGVLLVSLHVLKFGRELDPH